MSLDTLAHDTYGHVPAGGGYRRPSFWTKRKRTALSLLSVLSLIAGLAVAFKLFDRAVPNNVVRDASTFDFGILKREEALGETDFVEANGTGMNRVFSAPGQAQCLQPDCPGDMYPGDTRTVEVRIENRNLAPARDATFQAYITDIEVFDRSVVNGAVLISPNDPRWTRFVNFFTFEVEREEILTVNGSDVRNMGSFTTACEGGLREFPANAPCDMGQVKAAGSTNATDQPNDVRDYLFSVTEIDDGSDQSEFKGWLVRFTLVFTARLPAVPDAPAPAGMR